MISFFLGLGLDYNIGLLLIDEAFVLQIRNCLLISIAVLVVNNQFTVRLLLHLCRYLLADIPT